MAFTRSLMKSLGLNDDQANALMDEHLNVVNELKKERDDLKGKAEEASTKAGEIAKLTEELNELRKGDYRAKFEKEHQEFEEYKAEITAKAERERVKNAYRNLLAEEKIGEKYRDTILNATVFDGLKVGADGVMEDAEKIRTDIRTKWADFVQTESQKGAEVQNPPNNDKGVFGSMSLAEKMAYANAHPNAPEVTEWLKK